MPGFVLLCCGCDIDCWLCVVDREAAGGHELAAGAAAHLSGLHPTPRPQAASQGHVRLHRQVRRQPYYLQFVWV